MPDSTRNLHPNTVAFACLEESVAVLIVDVAHAIYSILNWRLSSKTFLLEILTRIGDLQSFECSHWAFSEILFPSLDESVRKVKISRWVKKIIEDMSSSLFQAVWIDSHRKEKAESGKWFGLPTLYKRGKFWELFRAVQDAALECDLFGMSHKKRRQKVRVIVEVWLKDNGAVKIIREKKEKTEKSEKKEAEKSDCPSPCAHCSLKEKSAARIERLRKSPNEDFNARIEALVEYGYQGLCEVGEINADFRFKAKHVLHEVEMMITRAREMIVKNNKAGLKLVGGQPK